MRARSSPLTRLIRAASYAAVAVASLALASAAVLLYLQGQWAKPQFRQPPAAFAEGTIGTELMPLAVAQILPDLTRGRKHFAPLGDDAGDWIDQFGFLRDESLGGEGDAALVLPHGFTISNYRPRSGAPSPARFVGIGCATCHTSEIIRPDGSRYRVEGTGNTSVNLFAWLDAVQAAFLERNEPAESAAKGAPGGAGESTPDYVITAHTIAEAYERRFHRVLGFEERLMISLWLADFRATLESNLPRFDDPFGRGQSMAEEITPTGPGRTQPFRTLVRTVLQRPGHNMNVFTKIAPVYHQDWQEWAQVDGGIRGLNYRSALAVLAAGATTQNMQVPEVRHNIEQASNFVRTLAGPRFKDVFPDLPVDSPSVARGETVYREHCHRCHGGPEPGRDWAPGKELGQIVPYQKIGTDPERVTFRHAEELPDRLFAHFPPGHPFKFPREDVRSTDGYLNEPIDSAFSRAPYLHNASVLTLAELIHLEPRRNVFYRGRNTYDPRRVGLASPEQADSSHYFRFDTSRRGNSNQGHDYPWPYEPDGRNKAALTDLLEYLKTI